MSSVFLRNSRAAGLSKLLVAVLLLLPASCSSPTEASRRQEAKLAIRQSGGQVTTELRAGRQVVAVTFRKRTLRPADIDRLILLQPEQLTLERVSFESEAFEMLATLSHLRRLSMRHMTCEAAQLQTIAELPRLRALNLVGCSLDADALRQIGRMPWLEELALGPELVGRHLQFLEPLEQLHTLYLGQSQVADEGVEQLQSLAALKVLWLDGSQLNDRGLQKVGRLETLQRLGLSGTPISDDGLAAVANLKQLDYLGLADTPIGDDGLRHLEQLEQLYILDLPGTKVSDQGVARLQEALPRLRICREQPSRPNP